MSYFAEISGSNNIVTRVIAAEQDFVNSIGGTWIQTSHHSSNLVSGSSLSLVRKNYAGIGFIYDESRDAFIGPKSFDSWILNEDTCQYEAPEPRPTDNKVYDWNEDNGAWEEDSNLVLEPGSR
jgi:hypothetical protein